MKFSLPFEKQDLALLRVALIVFATSMFFAFTIYIGVNFLDQRTNSDLSQAQARNLQAETSVREIADEEETIVRYIDRYRDIELEGAVDDEDRLAVIEKINELRARYNLYPIQVDIGEQRSLSLNYDPLDLNPGEPVDLKFSQISLLYSLVHEEDLTRLIDALIDESGLILPSNCELTVDNISALDFSKVDAHLTAKCSVLLFTFDLEPPEVIYDY